MKLDEKGINEHGVQMCACGSKRPHAYEPGEWCTPNGPVILKPDKDVGTPSGASEYFTLCGHCGEVTDSDRWTYLIHDYEGRFGPEGALVPVPEGEEAGVDRCPVCGFDHEDNDSGPGTWGGSRSSMDEERERLLKDPIWADLWIGTWQDLTERKADPDPTGVVAWLRGEESQAVEIVARHLYEAARPKPWTPRWDDEYQPPAREMWRGRARRLLAALADSYGEDHR